MSEVRVVVKAIVKDKFIVFCLLKTLFAFDFSFIFLSPFVISLAIIQCQTYLMSLRRRAFATRRKLHAVRQELNRILTDTDGMSTSELTVDVFKEKRIVCNDLMICYEEHASVLIENLEKADDSEDLIESARDSPISVRFIHSKFIGLKPDEVTDAGIGRYGRK